MSILDLDHASDDNPLRVISDLRRRMDEIERTFPSGMFSPAQRSTEMGLPGGVALEEKGDILPDSEDEMGLFRRNQTPFGQNYYTDHFRSGEMPTGFAWAGGVFTTPTVLWNNYGTYMRVTTTGGGQHFLFDSITTSLAKSIRASWFITHNALGGLRLDDGTDNNYSEMYAAFTANGRMKLSTKHRAGGGAATETDVIEDIRLDRRVIARLYLHANSVPFHYLLAESGTDLVLGTTPAIGWTPSRVGFIFQEALAGGNYVYFDWFYSDFS